MKALSGTRTLADSTLDTSGVHRDATETQSRTRIHDTRTWLLHRAKGLCVDVTRKQPEANHMRVFQTKHAPAPREDIEE